MESQQSAQEGSTEWEAGGEGTAGEEMRIVTGVRTLTDTGRDAGLVQASGAGGDTRPQGRGRALQSPHWLTGGRARAEGEAGREVGRVPATRDSHHGLAVRPGGGGHASAQTSAVRVKLETKHRDEADLGRCTFSPSEQMILQWELRQVELTTAP